MSDFEIVMVTNRTNAPYEEMFDGKVVKIKPNETKPMAANVARNLYIQSYQSIGVTTGIPSGFRLGIVGETDCSPIVKQDRDEILDRSKMESLRYSKPQVLSPSGLTAIPTADVGVSPVSTPVSSALLTEKKKSHHKQKPTTLTAKTMEFDNPAPRHESGMGQGSAIAVDR